MKLNKAITSAGVEYFVNDDELFAIINGQKFHFNNLPSLEKEARQAELDGDIHAKAALKNWGLAGDDALEQFLKCTRGAFNQTADYINHQPTDQEYWDCGQHGRCPYEGKICKTMLVGEERLSFHEIALIRLLIAGLSDKQIADQMHISYQTVTTHMSNIRRKLNCATRTDIAVWALQKGIC